MKNLIKLTPLLWLCLNTSSGSGRMTSPEEEIAISGFSSNNTDNQIGIKVKIKGKNITDKAGNNFIYSINSKDKIMYGEDEYSVNFVKEAIDALDKDYTKGKKIPIKRDTIDSFIHMLYYKDNRSQDFVISKSANWVSILNGIHFLYETHKSNINSLEALRFDELGFHAMNLQYPTRNQVDFFYMSPQYLAKIEGEILKLINILSLSLNSKKIEREPRNMNAIRRKGFLESITSIVARILELQTDFVQSEDIQSASNGPILSGEVFESIKKLYIGSDGNMASLNECPKWLAMMLESE